MTYSFGIGLRRVLLGLISLGAVYAYRIPIERVGYNYVVNASIYVTNNDTVSLTDTTLLLDTGSFPFVTLTNGSEIINPDAECLLRTVDYSNVIYYSSDSICPVDTSSVLIG